MSLRTHFGDTLQKPYFPLRVRAGLAGQSEAAEYPTRRNQPVSPHMPRERKRSGWALSTTKISQVSASAYPRSTYRGCSSGGGRITEGRNRRSREACIHHALPYLELKAIHVILENTRPQAAQGPCLVGKAPVLDLPLRPGVLLMARCRRGLLCKADPTATEKWHLPLSC